MVHCLSLHGERFPRIWTTLGGNYSYKSPGASYTAPGPQKQPQILKTQFIVARTKNENLDLDLYFVFQTFGAGSREESHVNFESAKYHTKFLQPEGKA